MDAEVKQKWVEALRSGNFIQGTHCLKRKLKEDEKTDNGKEYAYCCLGVLCEIQGLESRQSPDYLEKFLFGYDGIFLMGGLPSRFRSKLQIPSAEEIKLIILNDNTKQNFHQIADYIETNL